MPDDTKLPQGVEPATPQAGPPASGSLPRQIWVLTDGEPVAGNRGHGGQLVGPRDWIPKFQSLDLDKLKGNLRKFMEALDETFKDVRASVGDYELDEIEVAVEISADGEVGLPGVAQGKVGSKGSVTLKMKRPTPSR